METMIPRAIDVHCTNMYEIGRLVSLDEGALQRTVRLFL